MIEARFDAISAKAAAQVIPTPPSVSAQPSSDHETNGDYGDEDDNSADNEIQVATQPARKKVKRESSSEDADARLAAELQAREDRLSRGRVTRGANSSKPKSKAKPVKKKSSKRARSDDESEGEDGEEKPKRKAGGGFQKPFNLSPALSELCFENQVGFRYYPDRIDL